MPYYYSVFISNKLEYIHSIPIDRIIGMITINKNSIYFLLNFRKIKLFLVELTLADSC